MKWTYGGDPLNSPADRVRWRVGDTDGAAPLLSDGEVSYVLFEAGDDPDAAALMAARALYARFAALVNQTVGAVSISYGDRMKNMGEVIAMLRDQVALGDAIPYAGGISRADVAANESNPDRVPPRFTRNTNNYPGTITGDVYGAEACDPLLGGL